MYRRTMWRMSNFQALILICGGVVSGEDEKAGRQQRQPAVISPQSFTSSLRLLPAS